MKIVCLGGGPAGLYFGLLMKLRHPEHQITVLERNKPYDTFGWGVVFSDATMSRLQVADPVTASEILGAFNHWDDIAVHFKGETMRSGGHGFCGIGRKRLLNILQKRCEALGVELLFEQEVDANSNTVFLSNYMGPYQNAANNDVSIDQTKALVNSTGQRIFINTPTANNIIESDYIQRTGQVYFMEDFVPLARTFMSREEYKLVLEF